jgi:tripartite-type tricarboxylate transporter receptor subunit TctC
MSKLAFHHPQEFIVQMFIKLFNFFVALTVVLIPALAQAQYPTKPMRLVVPLAAGGPTDYIARAVAKDLSASLGQSVVVENKPGADGLIATREVIAAPADGYTLLFATGSMIAVPLQVKPPAFDWLGQLAPVGKVGQVSFGIAVHPDVPAKTVDELIAYARSNPDKLNYGTSTMSELMAATEFMKATGVRMTRVSYKGGAQAMPDLLAGRLHVRFGPLALAQPYIKTGGLHVLAMLLPKRSSLLPEVPTVAEAGYSSVSVPTWQSIFVPVKTPQAIVLRLASALTDVMSKPEIADDLERRAVFIEKPNPSELAATVTKEQATWLSLIDEYKLGRE